MEEKRFNRSLSNQIEVSFRFLFDFFIHEYRFLLCRLSLPLASFSHGLCGLNNQFTCVFVCHISISIHRAAHCARYKDLHPFGVIYFNFYFFLHHHRFGSCFLLLLLSLSLSFQFLSSKQSTSNWSRASDWKKMLQRDEIITRTITENDGVDLDLDFTSSSSFCSPSRCLIHVEKTREWERDLVKDKRDPMSKTISKETCHWSYDLGC